MTQYTPISKGAVKFKNFAEMKHPNIICMSIKWLKSFSDF